MRSLMPWSGMSSLRQEMDRLFDRFFETRPDEVPVLGDWVPDMDVSETKDAVVVKAEIPGLDPADIQVSLQENTLIVKGEKKREKEEKDEHYHRVERTYGSFVRTVRLPVAVEGEKVSAAFKNGLLTVTLPKTAAAKPTPIPVKAES
jgi:HSP20 family protein